MISKTFRFPTSPFIEVYRGGIPGTAGTASAVLLFSSHKNCFSILWGILRKPWFFWLQCDHLMYTDHHFGNQFNFIRITNFHCDSDVIPPHHFLKGSAANGLVWMKMNKAVQNSPTNRGSPFIETPLIEVILYIFLQFNYKFYEFYYFWGNFWIIDSNGAWTLRLHSSRQAAVR